MEEGQTPEGTIDPMVQLYMNQLAQCQYERNALTIQLQDMSNDYVRMAEQLQEALDRVTQLEYENRELQELRKSSDSTGSEG